jgi:hypothetical protein
MKGEQFMTNSNTDENIKTYQDPKILKFNEALGKILLFPFRLAFYAYKYIIRVVSIILFIGLIAIAIRSAYPMNLPEARGMTYYQFLDHRWTSARDGTTNPHMEFVVLMYALLPPTYLIDSQVPFCELFPDSKYTHWYRTVVMDDANYAHFKPSTKVTWSNLPASLWEVLERTSWFEFVTVQGSSFPPITYPED